MNDEIIKIFGVQGSTKCQDEIIEKLGNMTQV